MKIPEKCGFHSGIMRIVTFYGAYLSIENEVTNVVKNFNLSFPLLSIYFRSPAYLVENLFATWRLSIFHRVQLSARNSIFDFQNLDLNQLFNAAFAQQRVGESSDFQQNWYIELLKIDFGSKFFTTYYANVLHSTLDKCLRLIPTYEPH